MLTPEILAPVGGKEQLTAALNAGADAVYFGASDFNARRNADNFTDGDFLSAVRACHVRGVKVNVTLNTLVTNGELDRLVETLRLIAQSGADAVIVQDPAVAALVRQCAPTLKLHASTQMAAHNLSGVLELRDLGFSRVVLARELSFKEIAHITKNAGCEIEVFVHGAHCMSASGLCYMSAVFGGRSGNRGLCAQPCRLGFKNDKRDFTLSLRDLSLLSHLPELTAAGVASFKIEGRMKRPEYVAAAVTACRQALSGEPYDEERLRAVFSRSGFTDGYYTGHVNGQMFGFRQKEDVTAAAGVFSDLRALYKDEYKRVPLQMTLTAKAGKRVALSVSDGRHDVAVSGDVPEKARTSPTTPEKAAAAVAKLGGTPYFCDSPDVVLDDGLMLPSSALNALRREAIEQLSAIRAGQPHAFTEPEILLPSTGRTPAPTGKIPPLRLRFARAKTVFDLPEAQKLILDAREILRFKDDLRPFLPKLTAELPVLIYPADEDRVLEDLRALSDYGVREVLCENIGAVRLVKTAGLTPLGGMHLNLLNALAVREYEKRGVLDNTVSFENNLSAFSSLRGAGKLGFVGWGHLPLMRLRACPNRDDKGCGDCKGRAAVFDRRGEKFPLVCADRRFSTLLNPVPLCAVGLPLPDADFMTLYFTVEPKEEAERIARDILAGQKPNKTVTAGLYNKKLL